jgi:hypothetical protein
MDGSSRLRIEGVQCTVDGLVTVGRVQLSHHGRVETGLASAHMTDGMWRQVIAEATLRAVRAFVGGGLDIGLDAVAEVHAGRHPIIVVTMAIGRGKDETFYSGTAMLSDDRFVAVARAVLHGLNRVLEPFLTASSQLAPLAG